VVRAHRSERRLGPEAPRPVPAGSEARERRGSLPIVLTLRLATRPAPALRTPRVAAGVRSGAAEAAPPRGGSGAAGHFARCAGLAPGLPCAGSGRQHGGAHRLAIAFRRPPSLPRHALRSHDHPAAAFAGREAGLPTASA
jgi:hypothetical protein